jgi:hypothetical protein
MLSIKTNPDDMKSSLLKDTSAIVHVQNNWFCEVRLDSTSINLWFLYLLVLWAVVVLASVYEMRVCILWSTTGSAESFDGEFRFRKSWNLQLWSLCIDF